MTGAEAIVETALRLGVDTCFANPGTTELPLVAALDRVAGMRSVLGLFEGVCTGAADGYGRMAGRPALTLLHLGPGLANGLANLHNARRARTPLVNVVGDHASWHLGNDPPLASEIETLARPVSAWVRGSRTADTVARDLADAIRAAVETPGVATLIVPSEVQWDDAGRVAPPSRRPANAGARAEAAEAVARLLRESRRPAILLGGRALLRPGLMAAGRVAAAAGCRLLAEFGVPRLERGGALPDPERVGYFPEQFGPQMEGIDLLVLAGSPEPVAFFAQPGAPDRVAPAGARIEVLAGPGEDAGRALELLAGMLEAFPTPSPAQGDRPAPPSGPLTARSLGAAVAALQPEGAIVVDEGITSSTAYFALAAGAPDHTYLGLTGGAIGQGPPCATGAAIACPGRPVIALQADGSAMYTIQALWTQARESLDVTTVLCSNRAYAILRHEMGRAGVNVAGAAAASLTELSRPDVDWSGLARSLGVPGARAETADGLVACLRQALAEPGPHLVEACLGG